MLLGGVSVGVDTESCLAVSGKAGQTRPATRNPTPWETVTAAPSMELSKESARAGQLQNKEMDVAESHKGMPDSEGNEPTAVTHKHRGTPRRQCC